MSTDPSRCRQNRPESLGEPWHRRESRADDGRAVPRSAETWRGRQRDQGAGNFSRAKPGPSGSRQGRLDLDRAVWMSTEPSRCRKGRPGSSEGRPDVPGRTWCRQDGRGAARKDVVPPGRTWCRLEGSGAARMDVTASSESRQHF